MPKTIRAECLHGAAAVLGEGPVWDAARRCLWWVDIEKGEVHLLDPVSGEDRVWSIGQRVGFVIPTTCGDGLIGTEQGVLRFDPVTGKTTPFANPEFDRTGNRFNDAKCDALGRLWAGTMAISETPECGALYRIETDGKATRVVEGVSISNGLAWSLDGQTMFYVDSPTRRVDAFDFEAASGGLSNRRTVIQIEDGFPDGMCLDAAGNLWIALWGGWSVVCHDPRTGTRLAKIDVPVEAVTSCCFGGDDDELFITTASRDLTPATRGGQPLAGAIFRARTGVCGGLIFPFAMSNLP